MTGAIRRELTEETGSELAGLWRGQYDITKQTLQVSERIFEIQRKQHDATLQIALHAAKIEMNTANTVARLDDAVHELQTISRNTKPSQSSRDLGLG